MARSSLKNVIRLLDNANKELPVEKSFVQDLKRSMEKTADKEAYKPTQRYKPSSMKCIRNMYYQVAGIDPDPQESSACLIGICNSGTDIHERVQNAVAQMKDNDIDCEYIDVAEYVKSRNLDYLDIVKKQGNETKLYHKKLNMIFLCDGIIRYKGKYYILEIKTETIYKWQMRKGVAEEHKIQATAYSTALQIDNVLFLYINRDNTDMKGFMFNVTGDMKQELIGKIDECDSYVSRMIAPPKPDNFTAKDCQYCSYRQQCRKDG